MVLTVGVLALQGGFHEHLSLARKAAKLLVSDGPVAGIAGSPQVAPANQLSKPLFDFIEVRDKEELARCDALIIPGGESTTISLIADRLGLLEPLRNFVKVDRKPVWGTCAGLILLAEEADATKKGGQELIGGLDIRVHRNHFGRQIDSFEADLELPFLADVQMGSRGRVAFPGVFIRAPVVQKILPHAESMAAEERAPGEVTGLLNGAKDITARAPAYSHVDVLGTVRRHERASYGNEGMHDGNAGDRLIVAVRQGNVFGTSFHPELTDDCRIHVWWLQGVLKAYYVADVS